MHFVDPITLSHIWPMCVQKCGELRDAESWIYGLSPVVLESFWMFHSFFLVHSRISTGNHQKTSRPNRVVYDFLGKSVNSKSPKYRVVMSGKPSWRVCIQQRFVELKFSFEAENHTANEIYFPENHQANPFKQSNRSMSVVTFLEGDVTRSPAAKVGTKCCSPCGDSWDGGHSAGKPSDSRLLN